jgi:hypothetical protein
MAALFGMDSFGTGFLVQSLLALWLYQAFQISVTTAAATSPLSKPNSETSRKPDEECAQRDAFTGTTGCQPPQHGITSASIVDRDGQRG